MTDHENLEVPDVDRAKQNLAISRPLAGLICLASVVACLAYAYWRSQLPDWWRGNGGGIPYVIFWITLGFVVFPYRRSVLPICISVTLLTCLLEFLQLVKTQWLTQFRETRFGAALLGSQFVWSDIPPYFIGGVLGYFMLTVAIRAANSKSSA